MNEEMDVDESVVLVGCDFDATSDVLSLQGAVSGPPHGDDDFENFSLFQEEETYGAIENEDFLDWWFVDETSKNDDGVLDSESAAVVTSPIIDRSAASPSFKIDEAPMKESDYVVQKLANCTLLPLYSLETPAALRIEGLPGSPEGVGIQNEGASLETNVESSDSSSCDTLLHSFDNCAKKGPNYSTEDVCEEVESEYPAISGTMRLSPVELLEVPGALLGSGPTCLPPVFIAGSCSESVICEPSQKPKHLPAEGGQFMLETKGELEVSQSHTTEHLLNKSNEDDCLCQTASVELTGLRTPELAISIVEESDSRLKSIATGRTFKEKPSYIISQTPYLLSQPSHINKSQSFSPCSSRRKHRNTFSRSTEKFSSESIGLTQSLLKPKSSQVFACWLPVYTSQQGISNGILERSANNFEEKSLFSKIETESNRLVSNSSTPSVSSVFGRPKDSTDILTSASSNKRKSGKMRMWVESQSLSSRSGLSKKVSPSSLRDGIPAFPSPKCTLAQSNESLEKVSWVPSSQQPFSEKPLSLCMESSFSSKGEASPLEQILSSTPHPSPSAKESAAESEELPSQASHKTGVITKPASIGKIEKLLASKKSKKPTWQSLQEQSSPKQLPSTSSKPGVIPKSAAVEKKRHLLDSNKSKKSILPSACKLESLPKQILSPSSKKLPSSKASSSKSALRSSKSSKELLEKSNKRPSRLLSKASSSNELSSNQSLPELSSPKASSSSPSKQFSTSSLKELACGVKDAEKSDLLHFYRNFGTSAVRCIQQKRSKAEVVKSHLKHCEYRFVGNSDDFKALEDILGIPLSVAVKSNNNKVFKGAAVDVQELVKRLTRFKSEDSADYCSKCNSFRSIWSRARENEAANMCICIGKSITSQLARLRLKDEPNEWARRQKFWHVMRKNFKRSYGIMGIKKVQSTKVRTQNKDLSITCSDAVGICDETVLENVFSNQNIEQASVTVSGENIVNNDINVSLRCIQSNRPRVSVLTMLLKIFKDVDQLIGMYFKSRRMLAKIKGTPADM